MILQGGLFVDMDGTFIPGTEIRNRAALQTIVDIYQEMKSRLSNLLRWQPLAAGQGIM